MSDHPNIDALKEKAEALAAMLNDPHPGLLTWKESVFKKCEWIGAFAGMIVPAKVQDGA